MVISVTLTVLTKLGNILFIQLSLEALIFWLVKFKNYKFCPIGKYKYIYGKNKLTSHVFVLITAILNNVSTRFAQLIRTVA